VHYFQLLIKHHAAVLSIASDPKGKKGDSAFRRDSAGLDDISGLNRRRLTRSPATGNIRIMNEKVTPGRIIDFWFEELEPRDWFVKSDAVDTAITKRFMQTHLALSSAVPDDWRANADAALALIIVFDQFPRNIFRGSPHAFATDGLALREAWQAVESGLDREVSTERRLFFYMPFEHSENIEDQDRCVELVRALDNQQYLDYAEKHRDVILKFGRFPHRNAVLGRRSTPEEEAYLAQPGSGF
jgi:uncharacterized protein (DUF924 family)